jgi:hypothetical protein
VSKTKVTTARETKKNKKKISHVPSTMTKGIESGARPSGAFTRSVKGPDDDALDLLFCWLPAFASSSLLMMPHAARSLGSAAPVDVETTTSASRSAFVAATLQA